MKKINYEVANSDQFRSQADKNKIAVKNMTKKEKLKHFWFYYKLHTFGAIIILILIVFTLQQCATRVDPDISVIVMTAKNVVPTDEQQKIIDYFSSITKDVNGDGKKSAEVQFLYMDDSEMGQAMVVKLFAAISESNAIIYITDDTEFDQYNQQSLFDKIDAYIPTAKGVTEYKLPIEDTTLNSGSYGKYMSGLSVTVRKYKGTGIDKKANLPYYDNSIQVLKKLILQ